MEISKRIAALVAIAVFTSIVFASVFVYYPASITVSPVAPKVVFDYGSNANKPDLGYGNTIAVSLGQNATSLNVTIHPTYQVTYYKNITLIKNIDNQAYYVTLKVYSPATGLPTGSKLLLYIYNKDASRFLTGYPQPVPSTGTYLASLDLTTTGQTTISLSAGQIVELDIYVYIPEGYQLPSSFTVNLLLVYSPSSETPP
ncbi:hypothetical protein ACSU1N_00290 [Thermogladius sp. 4427co]|uniref:hypothetical protein n=1 Tax=Thermogladius sp. 4427co TaxID=3450718 RepID=UPI003F7A47C2